MSVVTLFLKNINIMLLNCKNVGAVVAQGSDGNTAVVGSKPGVEFRLSTSNVLKNGERSVLTFFPLPILLYAGYSVKLI